MSFPYTPRFSTFLKIGRCPGYREFSSSLRFLTMQPFSIVKNYVTSVVASGHCSCHASTMDEELNIPHVDLHFEIEGDNMVVEVVGTDVSPEEMSEVVKSISAQLNGLELSGRKVIVRAKG